jgi:hypothetical protein
VNSKKKKKEEIDRKKERTRESNTREEHKYKGAKNKYFNLTFELFDFCLKICFYYYYLK